MVVLYNFIRSRPSASRFGLLALLAFLFSASGAYPQVIVTEFSADNDAGLTDEEGSVEDWIEILNLGSEPVDLEGWSLTDDPERLRRWIFPSTNLLSEGYWVVFASGKDRRTPGAVLHTDFKLSPSGEYLALVKPDGVSIATEFSPAYPRQFRDVSFGYGAEYTVQVLVTGDAIGRFSVPASGSAGSSWTQTGFDDSSWYPVVNGVGYDTGEVDPDEGSYAARVLAVEPALYWRLDETSGVLAANVGTLADAGRGQYEGDPDLGNPGPRPPEFSGFEPENQAPQFDGVDDFVGGPLALLSDRAGFALAGWVRPTAPQASRTGLWGQNDAVEFGFIDNATLQLWTPAGSVNATYPHPLQEWHHVAAVGGAASLQLYVDGVLLAQNAGGGGNYGSSTFPFNAGGGGVFDASGNAFQGQIDEVSAWTRALTGEEIQGLFEGTPAVDFTPYLATDVRDRLHGVNSSAYLRLPFSVANPALVSRLLLRLRYDDGFVAWINGVEVASLNAPETLDWTSSATGRHADSQAVRWQELDLTPKLGALVVGENCLAIQGLNIDANNTDFLIQAELIGFQYGSLTATPRYFTLPTPGSPNGTGTADLGPILLGAAHTPIEPADTQSLTVEVQVAPAFSPIAQVQLHYGVLFGTESTLTMNDDGIGGDQTAGDGLWTAVVSADAAGPGQMIRYFITALDTAGHASRWPLYPDPLDSEAYLGTVVRDPSIESALPTVHLFIENMGAADTRSGTRASLFHAGELYDNVLISLHGQSSSGFPKKSYNLDFTADHRFRYRPDQQRVKDIRLMSNWGDKARVRNALAYDFIAEAGSHGHFAFQVRVQRNTQFFSIADLMEDGDDRWLERLGRDPRGALYKMYNNLGSAGGNEKKTRRWEDFSDLQTLVDNLSESRPLNQRATYAWDHLDLPQTVSYFVGLALCSSQDHGHKNFYVYCDNDASGEWAILPWDVDLSWGRNWLDAQGYFTDTLFQDNVLNFYNPSQQGKPSNRLYELIFHHPEFRAMVLRRLRSVMDTVLGPPGSPPASLAIEARLREMMDAMDPPTVGVSDVDLDYARWGSWGNGNAMRVEANRILSIHLPGRRSFLFNQNPQLNGESIPASQPSDVPVALGRIEFNPPSANQAEEFVELLNPSGIAVDISGWRLEEAVQHTFRPGTVIPSGRSLFVSPEVRAFRARSSGPGGNQDLFVQGNYAGQLNAWGETVRLVDSSGRLVDARTYAGNPSLAQQYLRITEIFYHPDAAAEFNEDPQSFEYLELRNTGPDTLNLDGVQFRNGVQFSFSGSAVTALGPGESVLIVQNQTAFTLRFGSLPNIAGEYAGYLDNRGETLRLEDAWGEKILEFAYDNAWYPVTDGLGFSLVVVDETVSWDQWGDAATWRPSGRLHGSPGTVDPAPPPALSVMVHEALVHTDPPQVDSVELYNPGPIAVDLGGWVLTDDFFEPKKYVFPAGTHIGVSEYLVLTEAEFNPEPGVPPSFALSSVGDHAYLFGTDAQGDLTGAYHGFEFGASPNGVSFGRYVNSQGEEHWVLSSANTLGGPNAPPRVGPVVLSEIMYRPPDQGGTDNDQDEYLELRNISGITVLLYDPAVPTNTWRLGRAVSFDFPPGVSLPPGGHVLVVGFATTDAVRLTEFRATYQLSSDIPVLGPWDGKLDNSGEAIALLRPDSPNTNQVPYILVEQVSYRDTAPWPVAADGFGNSLQRQDVTSFGNDVANWFAAPPTPGADNVPNLPPTVRLESPETGAVFHRPVDVLLVAAADDPDGDISRLEFFAGETKLGEVAEPPYTLNWVNAPSGFHALTVRAYDDRLGVATSAAVSVEVRSQPPEILLLEPAGEALVGVDLEVELLAQASDPDGSIMQVEFFVDGQAIGLTVQEPYQIWWTPPAAGSYAISAVASDDSGLARTSAVHVVTAVAAIRQSRTLVEAGSAWDFLDTGVDPGPGWSGLAYDSGGWKRGYAELGYGDGDEATVLAYGSDSANKPITAWFRQTFLVPAAWGPSSAELRVVRDDGVAVYLNGVELHRDNLPAGPLLASTRASATVSGAAESTWLSTPVPAALHALIPGTNVIAAEVHQVVPTSSDLSFDAEFRVEETILSPVIRREPDNLQGAVGGRGVIEVLADGTAPLVFEWRFEGQAIVGATAPTLVLDPITLDQAGAYQVMIRNAAGSVASRVVTLTVESGGPPLEIVGYQLNPDGTVLELSFEAAAASIYVVETAASPTGEPWTTAEEIGPVGTDQLLTVPVPLDGSSQQFYRIMVWGGR